MNCPELMQCPACCDRLIHQERRRHDESSSAIGQWIHEQLPRDGYAGDVDLLVERTRGEVALIRIIEHKSPWQKFEPSQRAALTRMDKVIEVASRHPNELGFKLAANSGVLMMRGRVHGSAEYAPRQWRLDDHDLRSPRYGWESVGVRTESQLRSGLFAASWEYPEPDGWADLPTDGTLFRLPQ